MNVVARSILICTAAWSVSTLAQEPKSDEVAGSISFKPTLAAGLTLSSDNLVEVELENSSVDKRGVSDLLDLKLGLQIEHIDYPVTIQTSIGLNFDSFLDESEETSLTRLPLELLAFYNISKHRIGTGISYHVNPALQLDLDDAYLNADADNTFGLVVEYGYDVTDTIIFGVRYLNIDYEFEDVSETLDGSHAGIYAYILF